jgi:hypothetical protein
MEMNKRSDQNLSDKEIGLLNKEVVRLTNEHKRYAKSAFKFGWIIPAILCGITILVSNVPKTYILLVWIGIGLILILSMWLENLIKTKKNVKYIKNAIATNNRDDVNKILRDISPVMVKTTKKDLDKIEKLFNIQLPDYYKSTILNYPFPKGSCAEEYLLPCYPNLIIENNEPSFLESIKIKETKPFCIGSDGGEEVYYIDLISEKTNVFVYNFERGKSEKYVHSWAEYLKDVDKTLKEIEEDKN